MDQALLLQKPSYSIQSDFVRNAINSIQNTRIESKGLLSSSFTFDTAVVKSIRGLMGPNVYRFQLHRSSTLTSNGAGILTIAIGFAIGNYSEGSTLSALFDEVLLKTTEIQLTPRTVDTGVCSIAWNPTELESSAPSAYISVMRLPGSRQIPANSAVGTITHHGVSDINRPYALTSADTPSGNIAGSWGSFWGFTQTGTPHSNTSVIYAFSTKGVYQFRNRA